jgi:hypothetical protein
LPGLLLILTAEPVLWKFQGQHWYLLLLIFLDKLTVFNKDGKNVTNYMKFINYCWKITINALREMHAVLKEEGFCFLFTRRINQDALEKIFGSVRQQCGNDLNPTPIQFTPAFKKMFFTNFFHTEHKNYAENKFWIAYLISITNLGNFSPMENVTPSLQLINDTSFDVGKWDYHDMTLPEQNAFKYICGHLINKCLTIHACDICQNFATATSKLDNSNAFTQFKAYNTDNNLFRASRKFTKIIF